MTLDEVIPRINWPNENGMYKVVQLELDDQPYLRFPVEKWEKTHSVILMMLLRKHQIPYEETKGRSGVTGIPAEQGTRYKVNGMGVADVNVEQRKASFFGDSLDYGLRIDPKHLDSMRPLASEWNIEYSPKRIPD